MSTVTDPVPTPVPAFNQPGGNYDSGMFWGRIGQGVNPWCVVCGSSVFCGGPSCYSPFLPLAPDGADMLSQKYQQVKVWNCQAGQASTIDGTVVTPGFIPQVA